MNAPQGQSRGLAITADEVLELRRRNRIVQAAVYVLMTAMVAWSIQVTVIVDTDWGRMGGIGDVLSSAGQFVGIDWSLFPNLLAPAIEYIIDADYAEYVVETIQMAYLGAVFGLLATVPLGWFASYNMTPSRRFVYPVARLITMGCRAVHEMIWAILFVSILGFGMLPGVLALTLFCIGFAGKLFSEEIEAVDMGPVEAMRAIGANLFQVMVFGVFPQIRVAFTGIAIYTWDVAFRAATVVGFFGAGGMGWYLKRNVLQVETERVAAILVSIIVLVLISEGVSAWARSRVMGMK